MSITDDRQRRCRAAVRGIGAPQHAVEGGSIFKLGRTVPVEFRLSARTGVSFTNAVARLYVAKISDGIAGTEAEVDSTSNVTEGDLFRYSPADGQYVFNLDPGGLTPGTCQMRIDLGDVTVQLVNFAIRP